ncbi:metallophosphoesterase family protein [Haloprofundus halobius]|uniref:metallophosphoesterase family protein n=1 Tax=Haloprofundus halobius TaxID=2876194 RepID=UPI001CCBECC9|nr:metallophosphoesterase [Haloprofundus halobius]
METTYEDLGEDGQYEIIVRVRDYSRAKKENRAFELSIEDSNGTRFPFIVWEKSKKGRNYNWQKGCWYRLSGVSVNEWPSGKVLHGTSALRIKNLGTRQGKDRVDLLYMTDSHLGKTTHSYNGQTWSVSPDEGFGAAIEYAIQKNVSAVVHGGDLFHNPGSGIDEEEIAVCRENLTKLAEHDIPLYFIYGNHERQAGRRIMERFVDDGLAVHLGPRYEVIGDAIALYGIDYRSNWDNFVLDFEGLTKSLPTILCIHQSLAPFTASSNPEYSLSRLQETSNIPFDLVLVGHTHSRSEHQLGECRGLSGGATARVGESRDELQPSAELVTIEGEQTTLQRKYL